MSDYCVVCGDYKAGEYPGEYVEVSNEDYGIYTDVWICRDCVGVNQ